LEAAPQFGESFNSITVWSIEPVHLAEILVGKSVAVKIAEIQAEKSKLQKFKSIFLMRPGQNCMVGPRNLQRKP
jgi:hypothetical protein